MADCFIFGQGGGNKVSDINLTPLLVNGTYNENFLTGFTRNDSDAKCVDNYDYYSTRGTGFFKPYGISNSNGGYLDSHVYRSDEPINWDNFSYVIITNGIGRDTNSIKGKGYVRIGDVPVPESHVPYDWTDWTQIGDCDTQAVNTIMIPVSDITGKKHLNIGIYHDDGSSSYTVTMVIYSIYLI